MIWLAIIIGVVVGWVPAGALVFRGVRAMERADPPRMRQHALSHTEHGFTCVTYIENGRDCDEYDEYVLSDPKDLPAVIAFWPFLIIGVGLRYAHRGWRVAIFYLRDLRRRRSPITMTRNGVRRLAGLSPTPYVGELDD